MLTCAPQEYNSIGAQNPNHTRPLKWFRVCCMINRKSKVLVFGPWTQVLGPCPCPWASSPR